MPSPFCSSIFCQRISSFVFHAAAIAFAIGWLAYFSSEKAICLKVFSSIVAVGDKVKLVTVNFPVVSVPVLSNTTCLILLNISKLLAFLNSTPLRAALPSPTAMAAGVARPMAHGHEITSTAMPLSKELLKGREAKK